MSAVKWQRLAALRTWFLVLAGLGCVVSSAFLFAIPLGFLSLGLSLVLLAYLTDAPEVAKR